MLLTCVFALKIDIPRRIYRYIVQYIKVNTTQEQAGVGGGGCEGDPYVGVGVYKYL